MGKNLWVLLFCLGILVPVAADDAGNAIGFWKTLDPKEQFVTSVMAVYEHEGRLHGRIIVSYDEDDGRLLETWHHPLKRIEKLPGEQLLLATDIFWDLERDGRMWKAGRVLDPRTGRMYGCDVWVERDMLVLKGKFGPFGMRQLFLKAFPEDLPAGMEFPEPGTFTPSPPGSLSASYR